MATQSEGLGPCDRRKLKGGTKRPFGLSNKPHGRMGQRQATTRSLKETQRSHEEKVTTWPLIQTPRSSKRKGNLHMIVWSMEARKNWLKAKDKSLRSFKSQKCSSMCEKLKEKAKKTLHDRMLCFMLVYGLLGMKARVYDRANRRKKKSRLWSPMLEVGKECCQGRTSYTIVYGEK